MVIIRFLRPHNETEKKNFDLEKAGFIDDVNKIIAENGGITIDELRWFCLMTAGTTLHTSSDIKDTDVIDEPFKCFPTQYVVICFTSKEKKEKKETSDECPWKIDVEEIVKKNDLNKPDKFDVMSKCIRDMYIALDTVEEVFNNAE